MTRGLAVAALAAAALALPAAPASAEPLGYCEGRVDAVCVDGHVCDPDWCYQTICVVWYWGRCVAG